MTDHTLKAESGQYTITGGTATVRILARLPEDHPMYSVVGRIASEWSHLEHMLDLIIWDLMQQPHHLVACVTSQLMGVAPRVRAIQNLLTLYGHLPNVDKLAAALNKLNGKSYDVGERRNRAIHDPWYLETVSGQTAQFKSMPSKDPQFGVKDVDANEQAAVIADIQALNTSAANLRKDIQAVLAASAGTPQPRPGVAPIHTAT